MKLQTLNMLILPFFLLTLTANFPSKAKGLPSPFIDFPNNPLSDHCSDPFPHPFCFLEPPFIGVGKGEPSMSVSLARVDWKETSEGHVITLDTPGLKKDDIKIEVEENRVLKVSGERKKEEVKKEDHWHKVERSYGKFRRQIRLPENVDLDSVMAKMENGVLTLTLNKFSHDKIKSPRLVSILGEDEKPPKQEL